MSALILTTKLYIPPPRPDPSTGLRTSLVPRSHLIERLNEGLHRTPSVTLVSAPAGFGKTTLVSDWLHQLKAEGRGLSAAREVKKFHPSAFSPHPFKVAWLSLDEADNDPTRFLTYLVAALQELDPNLGQAVEGLLQSPQPPLLETLITTTLINEITTAMPTFVLVLDDYHVINAQPIHDALTFLLDHLPLQMHLVIISRADPALPLPRLRARAELSELRATDLRFSPTEAGLFLNQIMGLALSTDEVMALEQRTEGWIVGLQLAALSLQGLSPANKHNFVTTFAGDDRYIVDYLLEEVLQRQSLEIQTFLLQTSILEHLSGSLCDAVLSRGAEVQGSRGVVDIFPLLPRSPASRPPLSNGQEMLDYLERANLFIVPLDNRRQWYRYHQLFAELLRYRLQETQPDQVPALHRRASEWYRRNGFEAEAVKHALATADFEQAAHLIEQIAQTLLAEGGLITVQSWLKALPDEIIRARPRLGLYHAWALLWTAQLEAAATWLQDVEAELGDDASDPLGGEIAALRAYIALFRGDFFRSIEYSQQALEQLPQKDLYLHAVNAICLGSACRLSGQVVAAGQAYREVGRYGQMAEQIVMTLFSLGYLVHVQMIQGNLHQAAETYQQALQAAEAWHPQRGRQLSPLGIAFIGMGKVLREWNDLEAAAHHLREGIDRCRQWGGLTETVLVGSIALAQVLQAQGDGAGAFDVLQQAERFGQQQRVSRWGLPWLAACRARLWLAPTNPNLTTAIKWAQASGLTPNDDPLYLREFEHLTLARVFIAARKLDDALRVRFKSYVNLYLHP